MPLNDFREDTELRDTLEPPCANLFESRFKLHLTKLARLMMGFGRESNRRGRFHSLHGHGLRVYPDAPAAEKRKIAASF